ncbi:MAG: hypothetical protein K2K19_10430, partial [Acetatifactor sp.]|nr:hypothetical protein [Acetatifactor sp.]
MKKMFVGLLGAAVLLAGCTAAAPTEVETESLETEQEPFVSGQGREEIEIQGSSQGEDVGEISMAGVELSEVLETYGDFLAENADENELFTLIYLDNDDIPELVSMHDGGRLAGAEIYTYKQGETVHVGGYGQWGWTWYLEKEGIIFSPYDHQGSGGCSVHRIEGTKDTLLQVFDFVPDVPATDLDEWDGYSFIYKVDGEVVSEEQYEEAWQKWDSPDGRRLIVDYCIPTEGTDIQAALTERLQTLILTQYDT